MRMQRAIAIALMILLMASSVAPGSRAVEQLEEGDCPLVLAYQINNTLYWVNGEEKGPMESAPMIRHNRTFIMVRYVANELDGVVITWDGTERKVGILTPEGKSIELWIDDPIAKINGVSTQIDPNNPYVMPFIDADRTFLPFRFIGENLDAEDIKWIADTKTVELHFLKRDCCTWTQVGRILSKIPQDTGNTIIEFDPDCDGMGFILLAQDFNLKAINADDFDEPSLYTIGRYQHECARFCVDEDFKVLMWEALPYVDCCCCEFNYELGEIPSEVCNGDRVRIPVEIKNVCSSTEGETLSFTLEYDSKWIESVSPEAFELTGGETQNAEIIWVAGENNQAVVTLVAQFSGSNIECGRDTIIIDIPSSSCCCDWEVLEPEPIELCPGEEGSVSLVVTNNCEKDSEPIQFTIGAGDEVEIDVEDFELGGGQTKDVSLTVSVPEDCENDTVFEYMVEVETDCSEREIVIVKAVCQDCIACCDYAVGFVQYPTSACPEEEFSVVLKIENDCDTDTITFDICETDTEGIVEITEECEDIEVEVGDYEQKYLYCELPADCEKDEMVEFAVEVVAYDVDGEECGRETVTFETECLDCKSCCDFEYWFTDVPDSMCAGDSRNVALNIHNECDEDPINFTLSEYGGSDGEVEISPNPYTFTVEAGESKSINLTCEMPDDCDDEYVDFMLSLTASGVDEAQCFNDVIAFPSPIYCDPCKCCDFDYSIQAKEYQVCPGDEFYAELKVENDCADKDLIFQFSLLNNGNVKDIVPGGFTLAPQSGKTVSVKAVMPKDCKVGQSASFQFQMNVKYEDGEHCGGGQVSFATRCKDCQCCDISVNPYSRKVLSVCPGHQGSQTMVITNNCDSKTKTIQLSWSRSSNITTISPSKFTLKPGAEQRVIVRFTMPECKEGQYITFNFTVYADNCDPINGSFNVYCISCVCCDVSAIPLRVPTSLQSGQSYSATYYIRNNCNKSVTVTLSPKLNVGSIKPNSLTLKAGEKKMVTLQITMPRNIGIVKLKYATFKFLVKVSGCNDQEVSFKVNYK